jgi:hypothetical protein
MGFTKPATVAQFPVNFYNFPNHSFNFFFQNYLHTPLKMSHLLQSIKNDGNSGYKHSQEEMAELFGAARP